MEMREHLENIRAACAEHFQLYPCDRPNCPDCVGERRVLRLIDKALAACDDGGWRTMESAPEPGTVVLLYAPSYARRVVEAHRSINGKWWTMTGHHVKFPTHWQPLPMPPKEAPDA